MKEDKRPDTRSKARLRWFLDFLYLEIDSLPRGDFFKLITELGIIILNPLWMSMGSREVPWIDRKSERQEIRGYQQHLKVSWKIFSNTGNFAHYSQTIGRERKKIIPI